MEAHSECFSNADQLHGWKINFLRNKNLLIIRHKDQEKWKKVRGIDVLPFTEGNHKKMEKYNNKQLGSLITHNRFYFCFDFLCFHHRECSWWLIQKVIQTSPINIVKECAPHGSSKPITTENFFFCISLKQRRRQTSSNKHHYSGFFYWSFQKYFLKFLKILLLLLLLHY